MTERIKCTRCFMGFRLEAPATTRHSEEYAGENACRDCGRIFWDRIDRSQDPVVAVVGVRPEDHKRWLEGH